MSHRRINITYYGKTEVSFAKSLVFFNNVSYRVNNVSYRNRSIDLQQKFFTEKVMKLFRSVFTRNFRQVFHQ